MRRTARLLLLTMLLLPAAACEKAKGEKNAGEQAFPVQEGGTVPVPADTLQKVTLERLEDFAPLMKPEIFIDLPWGSGGWMAGRKDGVEAMSKGPMSFALSPSGKLNILDQENQRILEFAADGAPLEEIPVPGTTFCDLQVTGGGAIVLLDRLVRSSLLVLDEQGSSAGEYGVVGKGIPEGGLITAMLLQPDGVWLEVEHTSSVHVLDGSLKPCPRTILPGRPTLLPGAIQAGASLKRPDGAKLWLDQPSAGKTLAMRSVYFNHEISRIIWIGTDASGRIYGVFHVLEFDPQQFTVATYQETAGLVFDGSLNVLAAFKSPHVIKDWYQFKEFDIAPDGTILQMAFEDGGVTILRWRAR